MNYDLILYHFEACPFCKRVRDFIATEGLSIPMKDTRLDPQAEKELIAVGRKAQVPCLFINNTPLYESSDIISWLKENKNELK